MLDHVTLLIVTFNKLTMKSLNRNQCDLSFKKYHLYIRLMIMTQVLITLMEIHHQLRRQILHIALWCLIFLCLRIRAFGKHLESAMFNS